MQTNTNEVTKLKTIKLNKYIKQLTISGIGRVTQPF